jgi:hypothetical protein
MGADEGGTFLVLRFSNTVTAEQVLAASARSATMLARDAAYATLLLFDATVDLSEIDAPALNTIRANRKREFREYHLQRRAGVAVVDGSLDAGLVMRLWNALSLGDPESKLSFEIFRDVEPALERLGVPASLALPVIAKTEHPVAE